MEPLILHYTQPTSMTLKQYADDLYAKSCKVADVYDESTLNNSVVEGVDIFSCHSPRKCWASSLQVDVTNIAFKA